MASSPPPPPPSAFLYQQQHGYTPTHSYGTYSTDYPTNPTPTSPTSPTLTAKSSLSYTSTAKSTPTPPPTHPTYTPVRTATSPPSSPRPSLSLSVRSTSSASLLQPPPPLARRPKPAKPKALLLELESFPVPPTHIPMTPTPSGSGLTTPNALGSFQQQQQQPQLNQHQQQQILEYQQRRLSLTPSLASLPSSPRQKNLHLPMPSPSPSPSPASGGGTPYYTPAASPWSAHPDSQETDEHVEGMRRRASYGFGASEDGVGNKEGDEDGQTLTHVPSTKTTPPTPTATASFSLASSNQDTKDERKELSSSGSSFASARSTVSALSSLNLRPRGSFDTNPPPSAPPSAPLPPVPGPSRISDAFAEQVLMLSARSSLVSRSSLEGVRSSMLSTRSSRTSLEGVADSGSSSKSSRRRKRRRRSKEERDVGDGERRSGEGMDAGEGGMERSSVYSTASGYSVASAYSAASGYGYSESPSGPADASSDPLHARNLNQALMQPDTRTFPSLPSLHEHLYHPHPRSPPLSPKSSTSRRSPLSRQSSKSGGQKSPTSPKTPTSPRSPTMPLSPLNPAVNLPLQLVDEVLPKEEAALMHSTVNLAPSLKRLSRLSPSPLLHTAPLVGSEEADQDQDLDGERRGGGGWGSASVMEGSVLGLSTGTDGPRLVDVRMEDMGMELESVLGPELGSSTGTGMGPAHGTPRKTSGFGSARREYPTHAGHRANESIATVGPPDFSAYSDLDSDAEGDGAHRRGGEEEEGRDARRYGEAAYGGIAPEDEDMLFSAASGSVVPNGDSSQQHHDYDYGRPHAANSDPHYGAAATNSTSAALSTYGQQADALSAPANPHLLRHGEDSARRQHQQRDNANFDAAANQDQVPTPVHEREADGAQSGIGALGPAFEFPRSVLASSSSTPSSFGATTTIVDDTASSGTTSTASHLADSHDQLSSSKGQYVDAAFRGFTFPSTSASSLSTPVKQRPFADTSSSEANPDGFQPPPRLITTAPTPTPKRPDAESVNQDETPTQTRRASGKTHMRGRPSNGSAGSSAGKSSIGSVGSFSLPSRHPNSPLHALLPRTEGQEAPGGGAGTSSRSTKDERRADAAASSSKEKVNREREGVHGRLRSLSLTKSKEGAYAASAVFDSTRPGMTATTSPTSITSGSSSRQPPPGHAYPTTPSKRPKPAGEGSSISSNLVRPSFSTMTNFSAYTHHSGSEAEAEAPASAVSATSASASQSSSSRAASSSSTLNDTTTEDDDDIYDDEYYYGAHPGEASLLDIDMGEMDEMGKSMGMAEEAGRVKGRRPGSAFGAVGGVDEDDVDVDEFGFIDSSATSMLHSHSASPSPTTTAMATLKPLKQTQSVKDLRLELRAERTRSPALRRVYSQRSAAGLAAAELFDDAEGMPSRQIVSVPAAGGSEDSPPATASSGGTDVATDPHMHEPPSSSSSRVGLGLGFPSSASGRGRGGAEMTLDEFGMRAQRSSQLSSTSSKATISIDPYDPRAPSPDIETILSASTSRRKSKSKSRSKRGSGVKRVLSDGAFAASPEPFAMSSSSRPRRQSEGVVRATAGGKRVPRRAATQDDAYDEEPYDPRLERALEGVGSDEEETLVGNMLANGIRARGAGAQEDAGGDSDSSLDLHTPLPNLMVRHGLLSPHSKLLPAASRSNTPYANGQENRPGSTMSLVSSASLVTKSGIIKDERDTPMRRVRHRDGKLLAGGIGLTTGLGWSDSEDEDAPSPLTHRLSTLNLSRRSSASSVMPSSSSRHGGKPHHPLARSYSSGALLESDHKYHEFGTLGEEDEEDDYGVVSKSSMHGSDQWGSGPRRSSSGAISGSSKSKGVQGKAMTGAPPPTAWQGRKSTTTSIGSRTSVTSSVGSRNSLATDDGGKTPPSSGSRMRLPSSGANSAASASAVAATSRLSSTSSRSTPYSGAHITTPLRRPSGDDQLHTPSSTASTLSLPMPTTPKDTDSLSSAGATQTSFPVSTPGQKLMYNKNKSLPPLPAGGLKKTPSAASSKSTGSSAIANTASTSTVTFAAPTPTPSAGPASKFAFPRARTFSATASQSASPAGSTSPVVRPLQLPRHAGARVNGDRAAVPVPSIPSLSQQSSRSGLRTPSLTSVQLSSNVPSPSSPPSSPMLSHAKPRTGTGMAYRSSSSFGSKMRAPLALSSSASTNIPGAASVVSPRPAGGSIGRAGGRAIPF
ncbi:hypothetical protein D9619_009524 [Psilocybe cf. subviscida]|uniref:Uncharacterized protein n=1 Tax=Psilocybe cf. subviscida TaxID=2480587 RepID=A0A8H5BLC8_9AGAR|nr:hypothetical protein D9619_009524 [Psilocybe cf. subviscida]